MVKKRKARKMKLLPYDPSVSLRNPRFVFQGFMECLQEGDSESAREILAAGLRYMNKSRVEKRYRIPRRTVYNLLDGKSPGLDVVAKVCRAILKETAGIVRDAGGPRGSIRHKVRLEAQPDGGYTAYIPALPGSISEGDSLAEARRNVLDALRGYLKVAKRRGL